MSFDAILHYQPRITKQIDDMGPTNEQVLSIDPRLPDCLSNFGFVSVYNCRVNVPVTGCEGGLARLHTFLRLGSPDSKAQNWNFVSLNEDIEFLLSVDTTLRLFTHQRPS